MKNRQLCRVCPISRIERLSIVGIRRSPIILIARTRRLSDKLASALEGSLPSAFLSVLVESVAGCLPVKIDQQPDSIDGNREQDDSELRRHFRSKLSSIVCVRREVDS